MNIESFINDLYKAQLNLSDALFNHDLFKFWDVEFRDNHIYKRMFKNFYQFFRQRICHMIVLHVYGIEEKYYNQYSFEFKFPDNLPEYIGLNELRRYGAKIQEYFNTHGSSLPNDFKFNLSEDLS